jgi:protein BCP1
MLDVSFDFFDPQPHDYHSIKLLLTQLLSHDAKNLELEGVVNLVLEQKLVGSTVKTDGAEGDPYAVLTVLNLNVHKVSPGRVDVEEPQLTLSRPSQDNPSIASLLKYLLAKAASSPTLHAKLKDLFNLSASDPKHVGLVLSERLVNMPPQVVPPMYRMLEEELSWARDDVSAPHPRVHDLNH